MRGLIWFLVGIASGAWLTTLMAILLVASEDDDRTERKLREEYENGKRQDL